MKNFIEALQTILPFMKNPDAYAPCQCDHNVFYIWGFDLDSCMSKYRTDNKNVNFKLVEKK